MGASHRLAAELGGERYAVRARLAAALAFADSLGTPFSLGEACAFAAFIALRCDDFETAKELAERMLRLGAEYDSPGWNGIATFLRGRVLARRGKSELGVAEIRRGIEVCEASGDHLTVTVARWLLAEALFEGGDSDGVSRVVDDSLAPLSRRFTRLTEAELHRLRAEVLLAERGRAPRNAARNGRRSADPRERRAEEAFAEALEVARRQGARSLELRAATGLARLRRPQGNSREARRVLAPVYGAFTQFAADSGPGTETFRGRVEHLRSMRPSHKSFARGRPEGDTKLFRKAPCHLPAGVYQIGDV